MKLLRLRHKLHGGKLTQCQVYKDALYMIGGRWLSIWDTEMLLLAAMGQVSTDDVKETSMVKLNLLQKKNEDGRWLTVISDEKLVYGSDHLLASFNVKDPESSHEILNLRNSEAITDLKYDAKNELLFVSLSKANTIKLISVENWETKSVIELKSKPITTIVDTLGQLLIVILQNRSIQVIQYDKSGAHKTHLTINQFVQTNPLPYRMTMSPQGTMIPMINSLQNSTVLTAVLLDRTTKFKIQSTLVGYVADCKILKFSPKLYAKKKKVNGTITEKVFNLLASSGNQDGNVIVWNTRRIKPLFDASKVVNAYITDIEWDSTGLGLFAISQDGQLAVFKFQPTELGDVLPDEAIKEASSSVKLLDPITSKPVLGEQESKPSIQELSQQTVKQSSKKSLKPAELAISSSSNMEFNQPSYAVPKDLKRKTSAEDTSVTNDKTVIKKQKKELNQIDFLNTNLFLPLISFSKVRLAHPKIRVSFQYISHTNLVLEVKNGSGNDQKPSTVTLMRKDKEAEKQLFQNALPHFITMCTSGTNFWAWTTETGTIYISSISGQMLLPPLIFGVPISFLEACGEFLLCVTSAGQLYCWNVTKAKLHFPPNDVYSVLNPMLRYSDDVLSRAENITMCTVTNQGIPILTLSNGDGYMFDGDMETWMLISDSWWAYGSQYWNFTSSSTLQTSINVDEKKDKYWNSEAEELAKEIKNNKSSILNYLEGKTNDELSRKGRLKYMQRFAKVLLMKEGFENLEEVVTLAHLENRILVSLRLKEEQEVVNVLKVYCIRLAEMGYTSRFNQTLNWLYDSTNSKFSLFDKNKRYDLLKEIIISCAEIRQVQRITTGYAKELGLITESI